MGSKLKKDDLADSWEKFNDFEEYKCENEQSISEYISKFDQKYNKIVKKGMKLPSEILAFKLLKRANLNHEEHLLVLTGMDYSKRNELYEQAKKSLKKFKGDQVSEVKNDMKSIKTDCLSEDVLYTGSSKNRWQHLKGAWPRKSDLKMQGPALGALGKVTENLFLGSLVNLGR